MFKNVQNLAMTLYNATLSFWSGHNIHPISLGRLKINVTLGFCPYLYFIKLIVGLEIVEALHYLIPFRTQLYCLIMYLTSPIQTIMKQVISQRAQGLFTKTLNK
uniref:Uncharacterized protein n=1 Tax=Anguilla anguilla TaxID=7936 RepID=A0A0E9PBA1_ANGAN